MRAHYMIARNSLRREPVLVNRNMDQEEYGHENFDVREIDFERAEQICRLIAARRAGTIGQMSSNELRPKHSHFGMITRFAGARRAPA